MRFVKKTIYGCDMGCDDQGNDVVMEFDTEEEMLDYLVSTTRDVIGTYERTCTVIDQ